MTIRKTERTITPPVQKGIGLGFFARSARNSTLVRMAQSRISLLKKVSLIVLQPQEVILFIWITAGLYQSRLLKVSCTYLFMLRCMQGLHSRRCRLRSGDSTPMRKIPDTPDDVQRLIVARCEVH